MHAPLPPLHDRISFLMHRVDSQLTLICNPHFRHLGVVLHNSRMLVILLECGKVRLSELVTRMVLPQSTISHQVKVLEKRRLVVCSSDPRDSRQTLVELTAKGRRLAEECNDLSVEIYGTMVEGLSKADIVRLRHQLQGMFERLERLKAANLEERLRAQRRARTKRSRIQNS